MAYYKATAKLEDDLGNEIDSGSAKVYWNVSDNPSFQLHSVPIGFLSQSYISTSVSYPKARFRVDSIADEYEFSEIRYALYDAGRYPSGTPRRSGSTASNPTENIDARGVPTGSSSNSNVFLVVVVLTRKGPPPPVVKNVSLDPNGGVVSPAVIECTVGETYGDIPLPTLEGYIFDGWYAQPGDTELIEGNTPFTETSSTLLKAHWSQKPVGTFTISFDSNGGSGGPDAISVIEGESATVPSDQIPTKDGATFVVWLYNGTDEYPPGSTITPTSDMVLVAKWRDRKPRPDHQKDYLVFGSGGVLCFDPASGSMVYAV